MIYDIPLKELRLFTDYGRASRPIFVVDNQHLLIKKSDIIKLQVWVRTGCVCWTVLEKARGAQSSQSETRVCGHAPAPHMADLCVQSMSHRGLLLKQRRGGGKCCLPPLAHIQGGEGAWASCTCALRCSPPSCGSPGREQAVPDVPMWPSLTGSLASPHTHSSHPLRPHAKICPPPSTQTPQQRAPPPKAASFVSRHPAHTHLPLLWGAQAAVPACSRSSPVCACACLCVQQGEGGSYGWNDLVASGYIEYVDTEEEETTMIAMNIKDLAAARQNPQVCASRTGSSGCMCRAVQA